ncbi:unnamed protein product [Arctia plantaginis]|uniref:Peptidase S1 domain-containing protein n=1 Tax=Arctia plantaginis TaxID=874455 RepID=A0A8S0ZGV3_ARCPL|nr:unnamed protein product [Arctia plantaginis]
MKNEIKFNSAVSRVALMKNPPYTEKALLAGWGYIDEVKSISGKKLKAVDQLVWQTADCNKILKAKHEGLLCVSSLDKQEHASKGDSGSALIVRNYIQIGLVSFKTVQRPIVYYSDTGYYYDWIKQAANFIFCGHPEGRFFF